MSKSTPISIGYEDPIKQQSILYPPSKQPILSSKLITTNAKPILPQYPTQSTVTMMSDVGLIKAPETVVIKEETVPSQVQGTTESLKYTLNIQEKTITFPTTAKDMHESIKEAIASSGLGQEYAIVYKDMPKYYSQTPITKFESVGGYTKQTTVTLPEEYISTGVKSVPLKKGEIVLEPRLKFLGLETHEKNIMTIAGEKIYEKPVAKLNQEYFYGQTASAFKREKEFPLIRQETYTGSQPSLKHGYYSTTPEVKGESGTIRGLAISPLVIASMPIIGAKFLINPIEAGKEQFGGFKEALKYDSDFVIGQMIGVGLITHGVGKIGLKKPVVLKSTVVEPVPEVLVKSFNVAYTEDFARFYFAGEKTTPSSYIRYGGVGKPLRYGGDIVKTDIGVVTQTVATGYGKIGKRPVISLDTGISIPLKDGSIDMTFSDVFIGDRKPLWKRLLQKEQYDVREEFGNVKAIVKDIEVAPEPPIEITNLINKKEFSATFQRKVIKGIGITREGFYLIKGRTDSVVISPELSSGGGLGLKPVTTFDTGIGGGLDYYFPSSKSAKSYPTQYKAYPTLALKYPNQYKSGVDLEFKEERKMGFVTGEAGAISQKSIEVTLPRFRYQKKHISDVKTYQSLVYDQSKSRKQISSQLSGSLLDFGLKSDLKQKTLLKSATKTKTALKQGISLKPSLSYGLAVGTGLKTSIKSLIPTLPSTPTNDNLFKKPKKAFPVLKLPRFKGIKGFSPYADILSLTGTEARLMRKGLHPKPTKKVWSEWEGSLGLRVPTAQMLRLNLKTGKNGKKEKSKEVGLI